MAQAAAQKTEFLTSAEVSKRWNNAVSTGTLANWRSAGVGPAYQKFGSKVRYPLTALEAYEAANMVAANDNGKTNDNGKGV